MQLDFYVNFPNEAEQEGRTNDRAAHSSLSRNNVNTNKRVEEEADRRRAAGHGRLGRASPDRPLHRQPDGGEAGQLARSGRETEKRVPSLAPRSALLQAERRARVPLVRYSP